MPGTFKAPERSGFFLIDVHLPCDGIAVLLFSHKPQHHYVFLNSLYALSLFIPLVFAPRSEFIAFIHEFL